MKMNVRAHFWHYLRIPAAPRAATVRQRCLRFKPDSRQLPGGFSAERGGLIRLGLLLAGSLALTAHVFVFCQ